jgi:hypothetical protein
MCQMGRHHSSFVCSLTSSEDAFFGCCETFEDLSRSKSNAGGPLKGANGTILESSQRNSKLYIQLYLRVQRSLPFSGFVCEN